MSRIPSHLFRRSISQKICPLCAAECPSDLLFCAECGASIVNARRVNKNPAKTPQQFKVPEYLGRGDTLTQYSDAPPIGTGLIWLGLLLVAIPAVTRNVSPISMGAWLLGIASVLAGVTRTRSDGTAMLRAGLATGIAGVVALTVVANGIVRGPDTTVQTEVTPAAQVEVTSSRDGDSGMAFDGSVPVLRGSVAHTGEHPGPSIAGNPYRVWRYDTGIRLTSTPAISQGTAYFGTRDGYLIALDLLTGLPRWNFDLSGYPVSSAPAVYDRTVYVGSGYAVYAVDAERGIERWRFEMSYAGESSPVVSEGIVYVASKERTLYALDAVTGEKRWSYRTEGLIYSSPSLSDELVLIGGDDGRIFAVSRETGIAQWKYDAPSGVFSTIAIDDGLAIVVLHDLTTIALDLESGDLRWEYSVGGNASPAVSQDLQLYVGSADGAVYGLSAGQGGPPTWIFPTGNGQVQSPVIVDDELVFAAGPTLYALDRDTGDLIWQYPIGARATTEPVIVDGMIYIGAEDGNLYAIGGDESLRTPDEAA